ncbi:MAG TPA: NPCBM/NEW2 domain-containing protein [Phycisphaerae bacterium]|nr:NPCBM/NEW2 domain-containing protein [Phycisphaerae bacterium]
MSSKISLFCGILITFGGAWAAERKGETYLADVQHRFLHVQQQWGELGINQAAHQAGQQAQPLIVNGREYARGLGHHAAGEIIVDLAGEFRRFEALIGVQTQPGGHGSVEFKVFTDDELRFESGLMRQDAPARSISIDVSGAQELRLVVTDGGDGIECDCANWLEARLVPDPAAIAQPAESVLDIAPFAEVVVSDPARTQGSRANRIEEYHADDVYLETAVRPDSRGVYGVDATAEKPAALGLKWLERRRFRAVGFELAANSPPLKLEDVQVQCWVGESAWQGSWQALAGLWSRQERRCIFQPDWTSLPAARGGTRKVRFIFPASAAITRFTAAAPTRLGETALRVQLESAPSGGPAVVEIYNGQLIGASDPLRAELPTDQPATLRVRYSKPRPWLTDQTVLRFRLPQGAFGVAVNDVLTHGCVYVHNMGLFVTTDSPAKTLDAYKQEIAGKKTVLEEVRSRPDQTFAQATRFIHNPAQDMLPTMLSLACDNHKIVVHRHGMIQFSAAPETDDHFVSKLLNLAGQLVPTFGSGKNDKLTRTLDGGWMPIVVNRVEENGIVYKQRTFVAPLGKDADGREGAVAVAEFTIVNQGDKPAEASLVLNSVADSAKSDIAEVMAVPSGAVALRRGRLMTYVQATEAEPLKLDVIEGGVKLVGSLPPRATSRSVAFIPLAVMRPEQHTQFGNADDLLRATREHWKQQLAGSTQIEMPDPLLMNVIKASQVHCLIAARNEEDGARISPWIASISYGPLESEAHSIIRGMDALGHHEFARKSLEFFIHRYSPEGMLTTGYTLMGTGWHLWTLGQHYELTQDKEWIAKVAPEVSRVCEWIVRQRQKTMRLRPDGSQPPEYGLMPPGIMADWNAFAYYFCLNGYYAAGLQAAAEALAEVDAGKAAQWREQARQFASDIARAYRWTQAMMPVYRLRNGVSVPGYPSQLHGPGPTGNFFPGEDGNRSWCYDVELGSHHLIPFGMIAPDSRETAWMMDHMEDVQFLSDGWFDFPAARSATDPFNYGGFAKVQPYYCRNGEINAMRDDVKPFIRTYFNALASLLNYENLSLQEHFAGVAAWNKTHETGYFLHQTRLMMVMERPGDELWLAPLITSNWLQDGMSVAVTGAPTRFGPVSYRITSAVGEGRIDALIEPPTRQTPRQIVVRLRHPEGKPMKSVTLNGKAHENFDAAKEIVRITPIAGKIEFRVTY